MMTMKNETGTRNAERGIAMFFSIFALLLLMAIAAALTFMASIETSVNYNYRQEQVAYFGAKAGIEEARARMMQTDPNTINPTATSLPILPPTTSGQGSSGVIYIVNPGSGSASSVQPWSTSSSTFPDDELCHDGYAGYPRALFGWSGWSSWSTWGTYQQIAPGVRCVSSNGTVLLPSGTGWYTSYTSVLPNNGTSAALPFKWVRISPKLDSSIGYLSVSGSTATVNSYAVNGGYSQATTTCWDGAKERSLTATNCGQMLNAANAPMTNVYVLAALGVSPSGARKMIQAEVALTPTPPFIYGMYSTSTACPAITFNGNNASTNSYNSANGTYAATVSSSGGDVGAAGGISVGNGNIGGILGVTQSACATPVSIGNQGSMLGTVACPTGIATACYLPQPYTFSTPPAPNPAPPTTSTSPSSCGSGNGKYDCLAPGTYGNISITQSLTLSPGIYNINSLSMTGQAGITVSPAGAVTLNVAGAGQSNPIAIAGNGIVDSNAANDFIINYAGTGSVSIAGNGNVTAILNAPNSTITQQGNGNWYGSILGSQMTIGGNAFFHYDKNSALAPSNNGYYTLVSYRELPY